jgi:hypothetical protein
MYINVLLYIYYISVYIYIIYMKIYMKLHINIYTWRYTWIHTYIYIHMNIYSTWIYTRRESCKEVYFQLLSSLFRVFFLGCWTLNVVAVWYWTKFFVSFSMAAFADRTHWEGTQKHCTSDLHWHAGSPNVNTHECTKLSRHIVQIGSSPWFHLYQRLFVTFPRTLKESLQETSILEGRNHGFL